MAVKTFVRLNRLPAFGPGYRARPNSGTSDLFDRGPPALVKD